MCEHLAVLETMDFSHALLAQTPQVVATSSFDEWLTNTLDAPVTWLENIVFAAIPAFGTELPILIMWLLAASVFFTVYLRFQPITGAKHSIDLIRGKYSRRSDPGAVTSFQALATELSGTVGLGNIAGVAIAIAAGGPGAAFWIIVAGFLGMSLKMAEATLGVKYRETREDGTIMGGPMYYLKNGLKEIGWAKTGKTLAILYAVFALVGTLGAGNLFQANQVTAMITSYGEDGSFLSQNNWVIGIIIAVIAGLVILGGITSIAKWTSLLTPAMAIMYILVTLAVLVTNFSALPHAFATIFTEAFSPSGVAGGFLGVAIIGIQRALFSNAAGVGTAGFAHSVVKTRRPATEGFVAMWEPFIDSVIICTMTALAIVSTGVYTDTEADGITLTTTSFATVSSWFPYLLTVAVVLFGFSTILSYSYYGQRAAAYLFGETKKVETGYNIFYLVVIVIGATISLDTVVRFSDAMFFLMTFPNILGMYFLARILRLEIVGHKIRVDAGSVVPEHADEQVGLRHVGEDDVARKAREVREVMETQVATGAIPVVALNEWKSSGESLEDEQYEKAREFAEESEHFEIDEEGAIVAKEDAPVTTGLTSTHQPREER